MAVIKQEKLSNGLEVIFEDQSNRYFGDYHRICVVATIRCEIKTLKDEELKRQAEELYGNSVEVEKCFERMGVSTSDVDQVRTDLIDGFLEHAATYLSRPDYPAKLVSAEINKRRSSRFYV